MMARFIITLASILYVTERDTGFSFRLCRQLILPCHPLLNLIWLQHAGVDFIACQHGVWSMIPGLLLPGR